ncbi:MAG: sodium-dependent transporter [Saprospiraceae bacterium]|nr:sodium-dependent transporter [Saprospiraceae bacterium]
MTNLRWTNRLSFIITTAAFSIGLGNIWRFPYVAGEGGGGAFLLVYLVLIALVGIPIFLAELALGRMSQARPMTGFGLLSNSKWWNSIGWLGMAASILIMGYYVMILAWILIYFWNTSSGLLTSLPGEALSSHFDAVASNQGLVLVVIGVVMLAAVIINRQGLRQGLERYARWMLITLLVLIIILAIWAYSLDGSSEAYRWYLRPDFNAINMSTTLSALGQLFFSVGVAMAVAFAFGSYTDRNEDLVATTTWVVVADTTIAILAGFMIFPALFTFDLAPDSGTNLIFITMAHVFQNIQYGELVGALFFALLFLGGFTSLIAAVHGLEHSIADRFTLSRHRSLTIILLTITCISVPVCFSYAENPWLLFGMHFFDFLDYLTNSVMLPIGGFLIVVFGAYVVGIGKLKQHVAQGTRSLPLLHWWGLLLKVIAPIAMLLILLNSLL